MPKLPTFTAQISDAPVGGGRRAGTDDFAAGNPMGRALQRTAETLLVGAEEEESRKALISSSEIRAKYARALDEAALSDTDTDKLKEQMQDELSKVGDGFQTTRGMQSLQLHQANTELMFDEQSNRIRVQRAAATARLEGQKFLTSSSELLRSNPGYLATAEQDADAFAATLQNVSPETRAEIAQGLKSDLNMAAAIAAARMEPEKTKTRLEAGEWTLTPAQREAAVGKADAEIRSKRAEEAYRRSVQEHEQRERDDKARDGHFAAIIGGSATRRAIMDDVNLLPQTREHLIVFMEARAKERLTTEKASDPGTKRALWLRVHAADSDPTKIINGTAIFEAVKKGLLNTTDANQLNTLVGSQKDENNRTIGTSLYTMSNAFQRSLEQDPRMARHKVFGAIPAIVNEYTSMVQTLVAERRAENDAPGLRELFTPGTKTYVGSPEFMQQAVQRVEARQQAATRATIPVATTKEEYDALPAGALYIGPDGQPATKGAKAPPRAAVSAPEPLNVVAP